MITNYDKIPNKYACGKTVAQILQTEFEIPLLSVEGKIFYFLDNEKLQGALEKLPWWIKIINKLEK